MQSPLMRVLHRLIENDYDLQTMQSLKNVKNRIVCRKMNISADIDIQLTRNVNKFSRKMKTRKNRLRFSSSMFWQSLQLSFMPQSMSVENREAMRNFSQMITQNENENEIYQTIDIFRENESENERLKYDHENSV